MNTRWSPSALFSGMRRSWRAVADAVGHCVLVFAFAPTLVALPGWLYFEANNPLNVQEPVVLAFVLVRGFKVLLDAFAAGVVPGVLAGVINGILVSAWVLSRDRVSTPRQRVILGAISGGVAACLMVLVVVSREVLEGGQVTSRGVAIAFEILFGVACGMLATPTAVRLLTGWLGPPKETSGLGRALHTAWSGACLMVLILLIGVRWLRYTSWSTAPSLDHVLREMMVIDQQAFLWPWVYTTLRLRILLLGLAVLVVGFHRRLLERIVRRVDGRWCLTPLAVSLLLGVMVWLHYLFDINPTVAVVCTTSLVLASLAGHPRMAPALSPGVWLALWGGFFVCALVAAGDPADRFTIVVWALILVSTHRSLASRVGGSDLALLRVLAVMPMNVLPAMLPVLLPLHGGTLLGDGLAYSFCESPNGATLYAAIPACGSVKPDYDECREGKIVAYDLATMKRLAAYSFFSPSFNGRLEQLVCLEDEVQVAVQGAVYQDRYVVQCVLSFPVKDPGNFAVLTADKGIGTTIAYDKTHDALFYSGEFDNPLVRYDRHTRQFDDTPGRDFLRRWFEPVSLKLKTGSLVLHTRSIHPGRNRIYLADWMQGRYAYAVDLTTLRLVTRYDVGGGGSLGVTVDPERDRLFVSSLWGFEVFDLATDRLIARKRTGLGNRPVIVDAARNRLYLSSMVEGKIRILDRDTFDVIGQIPIGFGSRYPYLSLDGKYLFASSLSGHYYWNADILAPFR